MTTLRKGVAYFCCLRSSARLLFSTKPVVRKLSRGTVVSSVLGASLCAVPFTLTESLSHDFLIRRAASLVTDSSSTFLSQTTLAFIDILTEYSKAVHTLIALQRRYLDSLGKLSSAEEDSVWQIIIGQRAKIDDLQDECKRFESTWVTAMKLCEMAAEASYVSGAEHASITVRTNIQLAQSQVDEAQKLLLDADKKLSETKVMEVERMAQYAASVESGEEEVPEAYLRED